MGKKNQELLTQVALWVTILGGMAYVTTVYFQGTANALSIDKLEKKVDSIEDLKTDLAVIKNDVKQIKKILDQE